MKPQEESEIADVAQMIDKPNKVDLVNLDSFIVINFRLVSEH